MLYLLFFIVAVSFSPLLRPVKVNVNVDVDEVREIERCAQKSVKSGCSLFFNGACLKENVLPSYSNVQIPKDPLIL